jgi:hypothetical protein
MLDKFNKLLSNYGMRRPLSNKFPLDQAIKLRLINNLTYQEIADRFNVSKPTVFIAIKPFEQLTNNPEQVTAYKSHRADLFAAAQLSVLSVFLGLTGEEKKDLMLRQPGAMNLWFNSFYNNERLERGMATEIQGQDMADSDLSSALASKIRSAQRLGIVIDNPTLSLDNNRILDK